MTTNVTTKEALINYITGELLNGQNHLGDDDNLLTSGLIDSLGMMRLVAFIEETFQTAVPPQDVTIDNFRTVALIATYVETRQEA